ncbi:helix-turn-helix transcriptional regulator [Pseudomaricurvus alkylphenolicus]|uniref:helix-turn-helix transcriptional regulator n=1 Tax=Pseudomaricurvus alkylphenolicus TaxID=1306991 RepID=UPI001423327F|nr:AraC family transcriptional regulator [Pseudomaricurvus alkylphenolicus]NIB45200.1 helix-turn-helix transcriptional regulator [Pseudomaricurvus alkylphenolicus]
MSYRPSTKPAPEPPKATLSRCRELVDGYNWGLEPENDKSIQSIDLIAAGAGVRVQVESPSLQSVVSVIELAEGVAISMATHRYDLSLALPGPMAMLLPRDMLFIRLPVLGELKVGYGEKSVVEAPNAVTVARLNQGMLYNAFTDQKSPHFSSVLLQIRPLALLPFLGLAESEGDSFTRFYPDSLLALSEVKDFPITPAISKLVEKLFNPQLQGGELLVYLRAQTQLLLTQMLVEYSDGSNTQSLAFSDQHMRALLDAKDLILQQVAEPPGLNELAKQVGLNRNLLNQGFKQMFDCTVAQFAKEARLQRAWILLQSTALSVTEVAHQVGYGYVNSMISAFHQRFGVSPKQARLHPERVDAVKLRK